MKRDLLFSYGDFESVVISNVLRQAYKDTILQVVYLNSDTLISGTKLIKKYLTNSYNSVYLVKVKSIKAKVLWLMDMLVENKRLSPYANVHIFYNDTFTYPFNHKFNVHEHIYNESSTLSGICKEYNIKLPNWVFDVLYGHTTYIWPDIRDALHVFRTYNNNIRILVMLEKFFNLLLFAPDEHETIQKYKNFFRQLVDESNLVKQEILGHIYDQEYSVVGNVLIYNRGDLSSKLDISGRYIGFVLSKVMKNSKLFLIYDIYNGYTYIFLNTTEFTFLEICNELKVLCKGKFVKLPPLDIIDKLKNTRVGDILQL